MVEAGNQPCDGNYDPDKARGTHLLDRFSSFNGVQYFCLSKAK